MKYFSFLASVILHLYGFQTLAPLPVSLAEMIRCPWCSDTQGMVGLFFWISSTSRKSWQRGGRGNLRLQAFQIQYTVKGQTRFWNEVLKWPQGKNIVSKNVLWGITGVIWTRLYIIIISSSSSSILIFTNNLLCGRCSSHKLTINSLDHYNSIR